MVTRLAMSYAAHVWHQPATNRGRRLDLTRRRRQTNKGNQARHTGSSGHGSDASGVTDGRCQKALLNQDWNNKRVIILKQSWRDISETNEIGLQSGCITSKIKYIFLGWSLGVWPAIILLQTNPALCLALRLWDVGEYPKGEMEYGGPCWEGADRNGWRPLLVTTASLLFISFNK